MLLVGGGQEGGWRGGTENVPYIAWSTGGKECTMRTRTKRRRLSPAGCWPRSSAHSSGRGNEVRGGGYGRFLLGCSGRGPKDAVLGERRVVGRVLSAAMGSGQSARSELFIVAVGNMATKAVSSDALQTKGWGHNDNGGSGVRGGAQLPVLRRSRVLFASIIPLILGGNCPTRCQSV